MPTFVQATTGLGVILQGAGALILATTEHPILRTIGMGLVVSSVALYGAVIGYNKGRNDERYRAFQNIDERPRNFQDMVEMEPLNGRGL